MTLRLLVALLRRTYTFPYTGGQFAGEIGRVARSIACGNGFSSPYGGNTGPTALVSPVYAYFLAAVFKICGVYSLASAWIAITFDSLCSSLTCWTVFALARRTFGKTVAVLAAWTWAVFPFAVHASTEYVWETCLSTFLLSLSFVMAVQADQSWSASRWLLFGGLWGLLALTNASPVALFPFLLLWMIRRGQSTTAAALRNASAAVLAATLCITPWLVRNLRTFHEIVPLRSGMPNELYTGTLLDTPLGQSRIYGVIDAPSEQRDFHRLGERAFLADRGRRAAAVIRRDPSHFLFLSAKRAVYFWAGNWTSDLYHRDGMALRFLLFAGVAVIGIWGLCMAWHTRQFQALYTLPLVIYPLIYYITHVEARYRHPIEPYLVILGVYAVVYCILPKRRTTHPDHENQPEYCRPLDCAGFWI